MNTPAGMSFKVDGTIEALGIVVNGSPVSTETGSIGTVNPTGVMAVPAVVTHGISQNTNMVITTSALTVGNTVIVVFGSEEDMGTSSCSDSLGNTYTKVVEYLLAGTNHISMWKAPVTHAGVAVITGVTLHPMEFASIVYAEVSGLSGVVDATSSGSTKTPSITTTVAGDFVFSAIRAFNAAVYTTASPLTLLDTFGTSSTPGMDGTGSAYEVSGTPGAINITWVGGTASNNVALVAAFKPAALPDTGGSDGDIFINTATGTYWERTGGAWSKQAGVLTTTGDMIVASGSDATRLAIGTSGQVLTVAGGVPTWATPSGGGGGAPYSSPGAGANSEMFGLGATAAGANSTSLGLSSAASSDFGTSCGNNAFIDVVSPNSTAIGAGTYTNASEATAIGFEADCEFANSIALGAHANCTAAHQLMLPPLTSIVAGGIQIDTHTPSSSADTGTAGQIAWDSDFVYVCVAADSWKRAALSSW